MEIKKCDPHVWTRCPYREDCGWPAAFVAGSQCDHINAIILYCLTNSTWIDVSVRLPQDELLSYRGATGEDSVEVICMIAGAAIPTALYFDGEEFLDEYGEPYTVTSWLPMPAPPAF